jgi:hypothetical protein
MALSKQPYKGARDFYPPDKRLQKYMFAAWREVAERFGYEEYDAPSRWRSIWPRQAKRSSMSRPTCSRTAAAAKWSSGRR